MDTNQILGFSKNAVYLFLIILLLVVFGFLTFHYYFYVSGRNGLRAGTGVGFSLFSKNE